MSIAAKRFAEIQDTSKITMVIHTGNFATGRLLLQVEVLPLDVDVLAQLHQLAPRLALELPALPGVPGTAGGAGCRVTRTP